MQLGSSREKFGGENFGLMLLHLAWEYCHEEEGGVSDLLSTTLFAL